MKPCLLLVAAVLFISGLQAQTKDSFALYPLADSIKAIAFMADVHISALPSQKKWVAGIGTSEVSMVLFAGKRSPSIKFRFPQQATIVSTGLHTRKQGHQLEWNYNWQLNTSYKLLIAAAADSAGNFVLYSGYIFLPTENKWKLVGTCKINGQWSTVQSPAAVYSAAKNTATPAFIGNAWIQRSNGSWKSLDKSGTRPSVTSMPSVDSVAQYLQEKKQIEKAIAQNKTVVNKDTSGVYYRIIEEGTGKSIQVTDTVTVYYQLRIFNTSEIIDQASEKPASFPLNRLIKAWQIAVPLVRTGGKLKIVIPSGFAYSIRTRAAKIPPNSILEFDIEVIDAKPAVK